MGDPAGIDLAYKKRIVFDFNQALQLGQVKDSNGDDYDIVGSGSSHLIAVERETGEECCFDRRGHQISNSLAVSGLLLAPSKTVHLLHRVILYERDSLEILGGFESLEDGKAERDKMIRSGRSVVLIEDVKMHHNQWHLESLGLDHIRD